MKREEFKKLIKESVKEAVREELVSSLLEVLKEHNNPITSNVNKLGLRESLREKMPTPEFKFTTENIANLVSEPPKTMNSKDYNPGNSSAVGEGSKLPEGEVSMNQIANLMAGK